jgi:type II secretory pathway component PulM
MFEKLSERDKRALKLGIVGVVLVPVFFLCIVPWFEDWRQVREQLSARRQMMKKITTVDSRLFSLVPKFSIPRDEKSQGTLFRDEFSKQLKQAGINAKSIQLVSARKQQRVSGYKCLQLQCRGECRFEQVMDLLAALNGNPYFVAVEAITLKCDTNDRNKMDITLTVSTYAK